jgi:NAD(P)-dependent dehydrogenase (short-subunit alcohol dehydrogenase family)
MPNGQSPAEEAADSVSAAELPLQCFELELRNLDSGAARPAVALPAGGEIWLTDDGAGLAEAVAGRLSALGCLPRTISLADTPKAPPDALAGLILLAPARAADDAFLRDAFLLVQSAGPALRKSGGVLLTVSRLDGAFGLEGMDGDPTGGGLAGLAKTAAKEWPEVRCKALDVAVSLTDPDEAALAIVEEMSLAGPAEVGITRDGKRTLGLKELMPGRPQPPPVQAGEVIIVTGGARGVTAEVAHALARAFAPTLVMFGRSPEPAGEPPWLTGLIEEGEIKRALLTQAGGRASPREIGEQYQRVAAAREIRRSLDRLRALGVQVVYRSVDVRDAQAVRAALAEVQAEVGPVKGLVHGAGVLADRKIEEKTAEQFERVYATKVAGLRNLLAELDPQELKLLILFSSSTARFGRAGQVDYAVANEVLNKMAQQHARRHPGCRVLSVNWGPWDGGMVTPALKQVFANEGIGVIPLAAGAEFLVRQLRCAPGCAPEVVVLGKPVPKAAPAEPARPLAVAFERELSLENCPVLRSHVLDGRAVLPLVLSLEWLAHGAIHRNPGLAFHGFNDLRALKGVRLAAGQSSPIRVLAGKPRRDGGCYLVPAELHAAKASGEEFLCARAEIVLAEALPDAAPMLRGEGLAPYRRERLELYDEILFHGADLQGIELVEGCSAAGIAGTVATAPAPTAWLRQPLRTAWLADPLALDSAFQLMVLWCAEQQGAVSLPCHVGRYRQFRRAFPREGVRVVARVTEHKGQLARADIEFLDLAGQLVARMENYECVIDPALNPAFRRNRLAESALSV